MDRDLEKLSTTFKEFLNWNKARIDFVMRFILALFQVNTVNLPKLALAFGGKASSDSSYRRMQLFFSGYDLNYDDIANFNLHLLPKKGPLILIIDRSNWRFGEMDINVFMIGVVHNGIAFPLVWDLLDKRGISNTKERVKLLNKAIHILGKKRIKAILGDREFIGEDWFTWVDFHNIPFYFRIKEDAMISYGRRCQAARDIFSFLKAGESYFLPGKCKVYGYKLHLCVLRLADEYLILATNDDVGGAFEMYRLRWEIETLFSVFKKRGFNLEDTHLKDPKRIKKLIALLGMAFSWVHLIGEWRHTQKPLKIKKHRYKAKSFFRYGLDFIQQTLLNFNNTKKEFRIAVNILHQGLNRALC